MSSLPPTAGQTIPEETVSKKLKPFWAVLIVVFAGCHALKLLVSILPEGNRPDLLPFGISNAYEVLTGSQQNWNMFSTIPSHHDYDARIVITAADGVTRQEGVLLPGFQRFPKPEQVRFYNFFERMLDGSMGDEVRNAYLLKMDAALWESGKIQPGETWALEVDEDFTRHLKYIRKDGQIFQRRTQRFAMKPQPPVSPNP